MVTGICWRNDILSCFFLIICQRCCFFLFPYLYISLTTMNTTNINENDVNNPFGKSALCMTDTVVETICVLSTYPARAESL